MTRRRLTTIAVLALTAVVAALPAGPATASWTDPADDLSLVGQNPQAPRVAVGPDGTATAVWSDNDGRIWASRRAPAGNWGPAARVSADDPTLSGTLPEVAAGPGGTAVAVWSSSGPMTTHILASRFAGGQWDAPEPITTVPEDLDARVAIDAGGAATVTWRVPQTGVPARDRIFASRSTGGPWSAPKLLSGDEDTFAPRVAAGPAGEAVVVWQASEGLILRIRAHRVTGGVWRDQIEAVSPALEDAAEPDVAMGPDGVVTVAWQRYSGGEQVRVARLVGDTWSAPVNLSEFGDNISAIGVAAGPGGAATVAWSRQPNLAMSIAEAAWFTGAGWSPAQALSDPGGSGESTDVAVGPDGIATVAWIQQAAKNEPQARRVGPGVLGPVHVLDPGADSEDVRVAAAPDGVVTAVWRSDVGPEYRVKSSQFRVPPRAPTGVGAIAGDAQATVSWSPPALTGGAPVTGYLVTATPGGRTCTTTGALSCTVTGLTNGIPHTFNVRAINAQGTGPASAESAPVTPMAAVVPDPGPAPVTPVPVTPLPPLAMTGVAVAPRVVVRGRPAQTTRTLTIRATLNRQARLRVLFQRQAPGLRRGRNCVAPTAALRRAKARPCARFLTVGSLTRPGRVGVNRITVTRLRVGSRTLAVGRYRVSVIAAVAGSPTRVAQRPLVVRAAR